MPGTDDFHDDEEQRTTGLILHSMLLSRLREWLTGEAPAEHVMSRHALPNLLGGQSRVLVIDVGPGEETDILGEPLLLSEVGFVNKAAMTIHLTGENTLPAVGTKPRKRPMESSDAGKKIYELNCLHVGSLAAKVAQASLGFKFFKLAERPAATDARPFSLKPSGPIG